MTPEIIALLASICFALFAVYGWLGLRSYTPFDSHGGIAAGPDDYAGGRRRSERRRSRL
jgi:hypothetical protein